MNVFTDTYTGGRIQTNMLVENWRNHWALLKKVKDGTKLVKMLNKKRFTWDRGKDFFTT